MTKITELDEEVQNETVTLTKEQFDKLVGSVDAMQSKIQQLEEKTDTTPKDPKAKYDWPRKYSYQMWWGVPVLSYKSIRPDITKEAQYKITMSSGRTEYINNHSLELTLAEMTKSGSNNKVIEVSALDYLRDAKRSDKIEAQVVYDWKDIIGYTFNTTDWGTFTISPNVIN